LSDRRSGVFYISVKGLFWVGFVERALGLFLVASANVRWHYKIETTQIPIAA
jgi:hypothetical protein